MATPTYTRSDLRTALNSRIHGKLSGLTDANETINSAVRFVLSDMDLRGSKRRSTLSPNIFDDVHSYALPSDVKGNKIIDIIPQVKQSFKPDWDLVPYDYFERVKEARDNLVSITSDDLSRRLLISRVVDDKSVTVAGFESLTADGDTWTGFGSVDDSDVKQDQDDFVKGNASVRFSDNGDTAETSVGLEGTIDDANLEDYFARGSVVVRGRLTTGDTDITDINVRLGSDSDNFYQVTDSTTIEGFPFQTGWNTMLLDLSGKSTTGSPSDTAIDYLAAYWTKTANTHLTDTGYAFDQIDVKRGQIHDLLYYSRFLWQNTSGTYIENSSSNDDLLNVFNDELELIITKAAELAAQELRDYDDVEYFNGIYETNKQKYEMNNPSEAMVLIQPYYEFASAPINRRSEVSDSNVDS